MAEKLVLGLIEEVRDAFKEDIAREENLTDESGNLLEASFTAHYPNADGIHVPRMVEGNIFYPWEGNGYTAGVTLHVISKTPELAILEQEGDRYPFVQFASDYIRFRRGHYSGTPKVDPLEGAVEMIQRQIELRRTS